MRYAVKSTVSGNVHGLFYSPTAAQRFADSDYFGGSGGSVVEVEELNLLDPKEAPAPEPLTCACKRS